MAIVVGTNSYVDEEEATTYFSDHYGYDKWAAESDKAGALISATQQLDLLCRWYGSKSDSDQDLEFPRNGEDVPLAVKDAQCEIAYLIVDGGTASTSSEDKLSELKAGSVTFKFDTASSGNAVSLINSTVVKLLSPFGICGGGGKVPLVLE